MNKKSSPLENNQPTQPGKKLQKQRQRILKELEEAQAAQAEALARFHRAETRLQKRTAELQRIAAQLLLVHQQLGEPAASIPLAVSMPTGERARVLEGPSVGGQVVESTGRTQESDTTARDDELPAATQHTEEAPQASQVPLAEPGGEFLIAIQYRTDMLQTSEASQVEEELSRQPLPHTSISNAQATEFAREARAVAEAAEQAAREAAERAVAAAARLEQVGSGARHLLHELQQMQTEVEQTNAIAQEAERAAREAEAAAEARFIAPTGVEEPTPDTESVGAQIIAPGGGEGPPLELAVDAEEETIVEPSTATMVAEVAAAAAAEAEAVAEASSARTREAHRFAQQADQALADARAAIRNGLWSGEEADQYLQTLEHEATRAHALLADAEAAEEHAQRAASNAEAEAEVAEGVAFTTDDQAETSLDEELGNED